jgi:WD40 repeat protein
MNTQKQKRQRGVVLTPEGLQKLQEARRSSELEENFGKRYTLEQLSERTELDINTVKKVLDCQQGVDKRTLEHFFVAFHLQLSKSDCSKSKVNNRKNWGEAICVSNFYGRTEELATLKQWLLHDGCRLVALLGMGGVGKTCLSVKLAEQVQDQFECVIWRSLQDAPAINELLANLIQFLSNEQETEADLPERSKDRISRLMGYIHKHRCLVVLDNAESLLCSGSRAGQYREGCEEYGELLKRVGEVTHQSCLVVTTREKPKEVAPLEGEALPVRSFRLRGLSNAEGQEILKTKGLSGSEDEFRTIVERYAGNALALKIVATSILDLFDGNVYEFLKQDTGVFGDIRDLLDQQFERLLDPEKEIMYWLAINREPLALSELREDVVSPTRKPNLLAALESLERRSLIEQNETLFTLQPVVMEYVTNRLIEQVCEEIASQKIELFQCHALAKGTAKDYVRDTQIRFILQPVIEELLIVLKSKRNIENQLAQILERQQEESPLEPGYTAGNTINLLRHLGTDLRGYDFSHLCVWQADLRNACLHDVNFQNADLAKSVFSETFGGVLSVAFSPDEELVAAGDSNGDLHLWRVADGQQLLIFRGHTNWVVSLAFSPNGKMLASGSTDHTVRLWNISTGQCMQTLQDHSDDVWSVVFSPDGQTLASGSDDCTVRLWNISTGQCLRILQGHANCVLSVAFGSDGQMLASGSDDHTIKLWEVSTGECLRTLEGHCNGIRSITLSPDGQMLASGSDDHTIKLWEVSTGECHTTFQGHTNRVFAVDFSPRRDILASGSLDGTMKLWSLSTGQALKSFHEHYSWVFSVAFNLGGDLLASGSFDQTVRLWSIRTGQALRTFRGYTNQVIAVAFSPDTQMLASGGHDRIIRLWEVKTAQVLRTFQGHSNWVHSVAFNPQGNILASCSGDKTIRLWEVSTGQLLKTFRGLHNQIWSIAFSSDGQMLASNGEDYTIQLWDVHTGRALRTLQGHHDTIWSIAFAPNAQKLASGAWDRTVKLWDISTGECLRTFQGHTNWVWAVAFSPDGQMLGSGSVDHTLRLWDISTGECLRIFQGHTSWIRTVAFSRDGRMLASGSHDQTAKLWDLSTGECLRSFQGHTGWIWSVSFCPDCQTLASGSEDETIKLWDVQTGKCLKTLKSEKPYEYLNLTGVIGLTEAARAMLKALGAVD